MALKSKKLEQNRLEMLREQRRMYEEKMKEMNMQLIKLRNDLIAQQSVLK